MKKKNNMIVDKKSQYSLRAFITLITVLLLAILLDSVITFIVLKANTDHATTSLLNQIELIINSNQEDEEVQLEDQKAAYSAAAQAVAYIISDKPEIVYDIKELERVTELLAVDEINIFDESGTIVLGTRPEYYGLTMDAGEQVAYFQPMLKDKSLTLCQDLVPNTAKNKK